MTALGMPLSADAKRIVREYGSRMDETLMVQPLVVRGIEKILASVRDNVQVIFIVNLVDYFSMPKPTLFMYFKEYEDPGIETEKIEKAYNVFYAACIAEQNSRIDVI